VTERRLFVLQRLTALILAPLVLVHLGLILYAVRDGLTAQEILGRTQGSLGWAFFYGTFVLAAAIHAPLGLRTILREWTGASARVAMLVSLVFGVLLAGLGLRAVVAVVA